MKKVEILQGTLDLLILKVVSKQPIHGYEIVRLIQQTTDNVLQVEEGSLYPALHRLEKRGWIEAQWGTSEKNRRAKYYQLTKLGEQQLQIESDNWHSLTTAIEKIMQLA